MPPNHLPNHKRPGILSAVGMLILLTGLGLLLYAHTFRAPFVFDDAVFLSEPRLCWTALSRSELTGLTRVTADNTASRVVANLTFGLNYYFGRHQVTGYRLVNLAVHIITAFLVFLVARRIRAGRPDPFCPAPAVPIAASPISATLNSGETTPAEDASTGGASTGGASTGGASTGGASTGGASTGGASTGTAVNTLAPAAAALLWLVHPLHIESVTYTWQRMNSLAAMFYLLAFYLYLAGRQRRLSAPEGKYGSLPLFFGCALAGLLALGSKQTALTLPLMLAAAEIFFFQDLKVGRIGKRLVWAGLLTGAAAVLFLIYPDATPLATLAAGYEDKPFTMGQRLLTQPGVVIFYLSLLFWPHPARLNLDMDFPLSTGLLTPPAIPVALIALIALIALGAAVVWTAKKHRLAAFALLWFLVTLVPESSIYGLDLIWGYRTYLPSVFIFIALAGLVPAPGGPHPAAGNDRRRHFLLYQRLVLAGTAAAVIISGGWTFQRNRVWQNEQTLWLDTARKSPLKARPHHNLGQALQGAGDYSGAVRHYRQALAIKLDLFGPVHQQTARTFSNLGVVYDHLGETDRAAGAYHNALTAFTAVYGPDHPYTADVYNNLCVLHGRAGNIDRAIFFCDQALAVRLAVFGPDHPETADIYNNLGMAYSDKKDFETAGMYFEKVLPVFRRHLGENHPRTAMAGISLERVRREIRKIKGAQ